MKVIYSLNVKAVVDRNGKQELNEFVLGITDKGMANEKFVGIKTWVPDDFEGASETVTNMLDNSFNKVDHGSCTAYTMLGTFKNWSGTVTFSYSRSDNGECYWCESTENKKETERADETTQLVLQGIKDGVENFLQSL